MTYLNMYEMVKQCRMVLKDYDPQALAYTRGVDTDDRPFYNEFIVRCINKANRYVYNQIRQRRKGILLSSASITGSNSVYTFPWDYGDIASLRDNNGRIVKEIKPLLIKTNNSTGFKNLYYLKGNTAVLDKSGESSTYVLYYYKKARDLDYGSCTAAGAGSITLARTAPKIADYYNGMIIENVDGDWIDTISDYSSARVATITETPTAKDFYGIVSDLPEPFHHLILDRAIIYCKTHARDADKPTAAEMNLFQEDLVETLNSYVGYQEDTAKEEHFIYYDAGPHKVI